MTRPLYCHTCLSPLESRPEVARGGELVDLVRPCAICARRRGVVVRTEPVIPEGYQLVPIPGPPACRGCRAPIERSKRRYCDACRAERAVKRCGDCGVVVPRGKRYCETHRAERQRERQNAYKRRVATVKGTGKGGHNGARPKWDGRTLRCVVCDAELPRGRGRPRSYCDECRARKAAA